LFCKEIVTINEFTSKAQKPLIQIKLREWNKNTCLILVFLKAFRKIDEGFRPSKINSIGTQPN
jgi:hypothetical protein